MSTCNVLLFAANPNGVTRLALEEECREIDQKIRAADYREELQLITKWAVRPDDLLHLEGEVVELTPSRSKPQGIARVKWTAFNQRREPVYTFNPIAIVPRRPG